MFEKLQTGEKIQDSLKPIAIRYNCTNIRGTKPSHFSQFIANVFSRIVCRAIQFILVTGYNWKFFSTNVNEVIQSQKFCSSIICTILYSIVSTAMHHFISPWTRISQQATVTFEPYLQWLCNLRHSIGDTIKMVPKVLPSLYMGPNLPCKQTFVKYTCKSFTHLYKIIHNSVMLGCIG